MHFYPIRCFVKNKIRQRIALSGFMKFEQTGRRVWLAETNSAYRPKFLGPIRPTHTTSVNGVILRKSSLCMVALLSFAFSIPHQTGESMTGQWITEVQRSPVHQDTTMIHLRTKAQDSIPLSHFLKSYLNTNTQKICVKTCRCVITNHFCW